jgi:hypothetical protein
LKIQEFNKTQERQDLSAIIEDENDVKFDKLKKREFFREEKKSGTLIKS